MDKIGSQVDTFSATMDRIRKKVKDKELNETAIKMQAFRMLKNVQLSLHDVSFLEVLALMDPKNPLKKNIEDFEMQLSDIRKAVEEFVIDNQFDSAEYEAVLSQEEEDSLAQQEAERIEAEENKIQLSSDDAEQPAEAKSKVSDNNPMDNQEAEEEEEPEEEEPVKPKEKEK